MSIFGSGQIIRNNLVLYIDIGNTNSYVPNATNVNNLISLDNGGSFVGGVTYSASNGGLLIFDGSSGYVNFGNSEELKLTKGSYSVWFKGVQQGATYNGIVVKRNAWGCFMTSSRLYLYDWGNNVGRDSGVSISDNRWRNVCVTFNEITGTPSGNTIVYIDGAPVLTTTVQLSSQDNPLTVGHGNFSTQYFSGSVSNVMIYKEVLTPTEVMQNYNALRLRFPN